MTAAFLLAFAWAALAAVEPVELAAPLEASVPRTLAVSPALSKGLIPPLPLAPDFAALDSRELAAARTEPSVLSGYLPGPLARWADALAARRQAAQARARPTSVEELSAFESLQQIHAALEGGDKQKAIDVLESAFSGRDAVGWYARNQDFAQYQAYAAGYYRHVERAMLEDRARAAARGRDAKLIAEARQAERDGTLIGRGHRFTLRQAKGSSSCGFHALCNAGDGDPEELAALAREKLDRRADPAQAEYAGRLGLKAGVAVSRGLDNALLADVARLRGWKLGDVGRVGEEELLARLARGERLVLSQRLFHLSRELEDPVHDYELLHHAVSVRGAFRSRSAGTRLYIVQDSGTGATDFYTWDELRAHLHDLHRLDLP